MIKVLRPTGPRCTGITAWQMHGCMSAESGVNKLELHFRQVEAEGEFQLMPSSLRYYGSVAVTHLVDSRYIIRVVSNRVKVHQKFISLDSAHISTLKDVGKIRSTICY